MPAIVDFEHEQLEFELASGTELGMPGLKVIYESDGRIGFSVDENLVATSVDINRTDANSVAFETIHMDLRAYLGGMTARAVAKDRFGKVTESEEIQKGSTNGLGRSETNLEYPSGQLKESIEATNFFGGHSSVKARDSSGRLIRSSELNSSDIGGSVLSTGIRRDDFGRTIGSRELMQTQMQTGNIVGDFNYKDSLGRKQKSIHFTNLQLLNNVGRTDAVVRDSVGQVTDNITVDTTSTGTVTHARVVMKDWFGRTKESMDVTVRSSANGSNAQIIRSSGLGQRLEKTEISLRR